MVIEIILNNKIQFFFQIYLYCFKGKNVFMYIIGETLILSFEQICNKISKSKNDVLCNHLNEIC